MNYSNLIRLEEEIKVLIGHRLVSYPYNQINVETYYAMDGTVMCRIGLFGPKTEIKHHLAKYEAEL